MLQSLKFLNDGCEGNCLKWAMDTKSGNFMNRMMRSFMLSSFLDEPEQQTCCCPGLRSLKLEGIFCFELIISKDVVH